MTSIFRRQAPFGTPVAPPKATLSQLYHENTKVRRVKGLAAPQTQFTSSEAEAIASAYKQYPLFPRTLLPPVDELPGSALTFDEVIARRRTIREFADRDLELPLLAKVLHCACGVTSTTTLAGGITQFLRAAPSAGALYPTEVYLGVRRVGGLAPGIYHYQVPCHTLELLSPGDPSELLYETCCYQDFVRAAPVVMLLSSVMQRTKGKYGERGYRYLLIETGHMAQNICLAATSHGLAVTTTAGFFDDEANRVLGLDGEDEGVLYVALLGYPAEDQRG